MTSTRSPFPPVCSLHGVETERLRFERLETERLQSWAALFDSPDTARFLGLDPALDALSLAQHWFDKTFDRYREGSGGQHALIFKETGEFVAQCGLMIQRFKGRDILEVGYAVLPQYRGNGYALEAARCAKELAFSKHDVEIVHSMIHPDNWASARVAELNGMHVLAKDLEADMPTELWGVKRD